MANEVKEIPTQAVEIETATQDISDQKDSPDPATPTATPQPEKSPAQTGLATQAHPGTPAPSAPAKGPVPASGQKVLAQKLQNKIASNKIASPVKKPDPNLSLVQKTAAIMGHSAGIVPAGIEDVDTNALSTSFFHCLLYGPPDSLKTTTGALFGGPEHTAMVVTRRREQVIPLAGLGFNKVKVVKTPEALRYVLLYPEKVFGEEWANDPERVLMVDDLTEGTDVLVDDHKAYFNDKGDLIQVKDPRRAYKAAGDEFHDLIKINLNRPQHVILTAVQKEYEVEGTIDYYIQPDMPNKMMMLIETELEFVFHMEMGRDVMLTTNKMVTRIGKEKNPVTRQPDTWREITFAKQKFPLKFAGMNILKNEEQKNLRSVWEKIHAALKGDVAVATKKPVGGLKAGVPATRPSIKP